MTDGNGSSRRELPEAWLPILGPLRRTAWRPRIAKGDGHLLASKYGGIAAIPEGERWPFCGDCGRPLELLLQLSALDLPREAWPGGRPLILQLFFCRNESAEGDPTCRTSGPFSAASRVRILPYIEFERGEDGLPILPRKRYEAMERSPAENPIAPLGIVGWDSIDDYPGGEDLDAEGVDLPEEPGFPSEGQCASGDKLGGWPYWIQSPRRPRCPACGAEMDQVFQIGYEGNLPFMLGDAGSGFVSICPARHHATFHWDSC